MDNITKVISYTFTQEELSLIHDILTGTVDTNKVFRRVRIKNQKSIIIKPKRQPSTVLSYIRITINKDTKTGKCVLYLKEHMTNMQIKYTLTKEDLQSNGNLHWLELFLYRYNYFFSFY